MVEASAGTGKTTALVNRIVEVIAAGAPRRHDSRGHVHACRGRQYEAAGAAGTGTAARERAGSRRPGTSRARRRAALDRAFIGTIHAFCAQLLRRRPVEAGVDPVFQELAQPEAMRVFARVFERWIEQRLAAPSPALRARWRASRAR